MMFDGCFLAEVDSHELLIRESPFGVDSLGHTMVADLSCGRACTTLSIEAEGMTRTYLVESFSCSDGEPTRITLVGGLKALTYRCFIGDGSAARMGLRQLAYVDPLAHAHSKVFDSGWSKPVRPCGACEGTGTVQDSPFRSISYCRCALGQSLQASREAGWSR